MSDRTLGAVEPLDYRFLLLTHMVCADQQIHSEEAKALQELAQHTKMGQRSIEEMEKILAQDEQLLSVEDIARKVPPGQQSEVMRQILAMAYIDGFFSPLEREMVEILGEIWNWSKGEIERLIEQAEEVGTGKRSVDDDNNLPDLSVGARLVKGADSIFSRALVDNLAKIAPENVGRQIEQLRREILLSGPEYDDAIQQCAAIATEDYKFAEIALKGTRLALNNLGKGIQDQLTAIQSKTTSKGEAKTAAEVAKQLETTRKALTVEILKEIESLRASLSAKQRALNHFSIAFMGKTKAGKSTLHAIVTGVGWDAIGVGKQRTTRLNRVYEWKNIRIIDTPGIGAPGGKSDEEIAQSVIEESDVICYVVTNDSIQETEFKFLQLLKEKAKPLIILLNVKHNLRDSRRLEHFLKDPDKLFAIEGTSGLGGHIERIRRYAQQHYANDYFDIIPVMLLAAQLSREPEHKELKDKLFKASRMPNFLDSIRVSLVEHGPIRRSQTLLGSTVGAIDNPYKWVNQQAQLYQLLTDTLKTKRDTIRKDIQKAAKDNSASLVQQIEAIFQDALNAIPSFAEDYWDSNEIGLKLGWERKLKAIHFDERLKNAYEETSKKFNKEVQEALEEVGNELQLIAKLDGRNFTFTEQDSNNIRDLLRIGGNILGIAGAVITIFAPPIGIAIGIAATVVGLMTGLFKSKDEKRREAVQKISNTLFSQLNNHHQTTRQQAKDDFGKYCDAVAMNINTYFEELITGLEAIAEQLETAKSKLDGTANYLNRAYAKRIIDWCLDKYEPLTDEVIYKNIFVDRRAAMARFDTPIRIALGCVDEAQLSFTRNSSEDSAFLEVLTRLSRTVRKERVDAKRLVARHRLRIKVKNIALEMSSAVAKEGTTLSIVVGSEQNFEILNKQAELNVQKHYEKAESKIQEAVDTAVESVREEVEQVLSGNLVQTFVACLEKSQNVSGQDVDSSMDVERIKGQVNWLKNIGETAGVQLSNFATRSFAHTAGKGFLHSLDVAGSGLHQGVLAVGKFVGFKFKPWQAVGIAKNIGNAAKFLGPAVALIAVGVDIHASIQEKQREKQMADVRRDINSQFQAIAKDLENQMELQLREVESQVYGEIEKQIAAARQQEESAIAASNTWVKQLAEIRSDFDLILRYITKATENTLI